MYLLHQAFTVPLNRFPPDESILIGFGLNLCPVNVFHIQPDEAFGREKEYGLGKYLVDFLFHPVAETVDGNEIRFLIARYNGCHDEGAFQFSGRNRRCSYRHRE